MSISRVVCLENPPQGWDDFVARHPQGSLYHDSRWAPLIRSCFGHSTFFLASLTSNEINGALPLVHLNSRLFGNALVSMPYFNYGGLLYYDSSTAQGLISASVELSKRLRTGYIELRQNQPAPGDWPTRSHKVVMILPLPSDIEALWASFKTKLRTRVRRAEKEGFTVHIGQAEFLDDFYKVFAENMRDLGTPVYSRRFFQSILQTFPSNAHIVAIRKENQCVAAAFLLSHRQKMEVPWASSLRRFNHLSPNMLLYWNLLKFSITQRCNVFDFGRSTRDSGTYAFKEQWGSSPQDTFWVYPGSDRHRLPDHSPQNWKYYWATRLWSKLPVPVANACGPWIVRNIP